MIDAFWLATQYTQGYQKPGGLSRKKKGKRKNKYKKYNWTTGARI